MKAGHTWEALVKFFATVLERARPHDESVSVDDFVRGLIENDHESEVDIEFDEMDCWPPLYSTTRGTMLMKDVLGSPAE